MEGMTGVVFGAVRGDGVKDGGHGRDDGGGVWGRVWRNISAHLFYIVHQSVQVRTVLSSIRLCLDTHVIC